MTDASAAGGNTARRVLGMVMAGMGALFTAGAIVGVIAAASEDGNAMSVTAIAIIAGLGLLLLALLYALANLVRKIGPAPADLTRREKLNRNIMTGSGLLGAAIGVTLAISGGVDLENAGASQFDLLSDGPMPLLIALFLAFCWGVVMPVVAWFWHTRAIDEQEASAYRDGGYYAAYAYLIGAPTWWILWRGGLLPEPDGVAIFILFATIWSAVWFWKKYR